MVTGSVISVEVWDTVMRMLTGTGSATTMEFVSLAVDATAGDTAIGDSTYYREVSVQCGVKRTPIKPWNDMPTW